MLEKGSIKSLRETYKVPKGEEQDVHYAIERVSYSQKTGEKISHYDIIKTNLAMFEGVKRNLELQGYTVVILYHPQGKYNEPIVLNESVEDKLAERDAEIEKLKAQLAALKKDEAKDENAAKNEEAKENLPNLDGGENEEKPKRRKNAK